MPAAMDGFARAVDRLQGAAADVAEQLLTIWLPIQIGLLALATFLAAAVAALIRRRVDILALTMGWPPLLRGLFRALLANLGAILFIGIVGLMLLAAQRTTAPENDYLLSVAINLAVAWVIIAILTSVIHNTFFNRLVAVTAWLIAALSILGLLQPTIAALDSVGMMVGGLRLTPLLAIKTAVLLLLALWLASAVSNSIEQRLRAVADVTPSVQVLMSKMIRLVLITLAVVIVAGTVGIDLTALAVFSGAVGVGIGFGLQKIVSNFLGGIILLADRSIKPGDVISVGDSFGWVVSMNARHTVVTRRDGREILLPNEDLITNKVINWSYSKSEIRVDMPFPADVGSDPHTVRRIALEAVSTVPRVLQKPAPVCHFIGFSSASLDFLLRFWIDDPEAGVTNVKSAVLLALWDGLRREGVMIPSPIQDMRLRGTAKMQTMLERELPPDSQPPRREQIP